MRNFGLFLLLVIVFSGCNRKTLDSSRDIEKAVKDNEEQNESISESEEKSIDSLLYACRVNFSEALTPISDGVNKRSWLQDIPDSMHYWRKFLDNASCSSYVFIDFMRSITSDVYSVPEEVQSDLWEFCIERYKWTVDTVVEYLGQPLYSDTMQLENYKQLPFSGVRLYYPEEGSMDFERKFEPNQIHPPWQGYILHIPDAENMQLRYDYRKKRGEISGE